jgi:hypothetical protein
VFVPSVDFDLSPLWTRRICYGTSELFVCSDLYSSVRLSCRITRYFVEYAFISLVMKQVLRIDSRQDDPHPVLGF